MDDRPSGPDRAVCAATLSWSGRPCCCRATERAHRRTVATVAVGLLAVEPLAYQKPRAAGSLRSRVADAELRLFSPTALTATVSWMPAAARIRSGAPLIRRSRRSTSHNFRVSLLPAAHRPATRVVRGRRPARRSFKVQPTALDPLSVRYIVSDGTVPHFDAGVKARYPLVFTDRRSTWRSTRTATRPRRTQPGADGARRPVRVSRPHPHEADAQLLSSARGPWSAAAPGETVRRRSALRQHQGGGRGRRAPVGPRAHRRAAHGWRASVNGTSQHLARSTKSCGVVVGRKSTFVFSYRSPPRTIGAAISR
jgi:hypothetical protein